MNTTIRMWSIMAAGLLMGATVNSAHAITITIDGVNSPTTLSAAVAQAFTADDGPDIINITTDTLATADLAIFIDKPITINGDADNNGTPADILVDMATLKTAGNADIGIMGYKSYLEIQASGDVTINNLNIHPNSDGAFAGAGNSAAQNVSGIRVFKPANSADTLALNLTKVRIAPSRGATNTFTSLATSDNLYNLSNIKLWGGLNGTTEANFVLHAGIHFSDDAIGQGTINAILDHCEAGASRGCGINITGLNVNVQILGGTYGHCARDGIRIAASSNVTVKGTVTDRVRIIRSTNITGNNSHGLEVTGISSAPPTVVPLIEYVDVAGVQTANSFSLREGKITEVNYVRALGKFVTAGLAAPTNEVLYVNSATNDLDLIRNSTFYGFYNNTAHITSTVNVNPVEIRDTVFAANSTTIAVNVNSPSPAGVTFNNCALPNDALAGESLANPAVIGSGAITLNNIVNASPQFMLGINDYDWTDNQGASNPLNGAGNRNVLRPALSNAAYATASSTGGRLTGGAGPDPASVSEWMMY